MSLGMEGLNWASASLQLPAPSSSNMVPPDYRTWSSVFEGLPESRRTEVFENIVLPQLEVYSTGDDVNAFSARNRQWVGELSPAGSGFETLLAAFRADPNGTISKVSAFVKSLAATMIAVSFKTYSKNFAAQLKARAVQTGQSEDLVDQTFEEYISLFKQSEEELGSNAYWRAFGAQIGRFVVSTGCPVAADDPLESLEALRSHVLANPAAALATPTESAKNADTHRKPSSRGGFFIAIICALPCEANAVSLLFDEFWDDDAPMYGRASGDVNTYATGRIGVHDVVLLVLSDAGTNAAAGAAAALRSSFSNLKLVLIVGVCGGVPKVGGHDAFLGDVVISKRIVQFDYGRQYPDLGRPNRDIRNFLSSLETELGMERLRTKTIRLLQRLQDTARTKRRRADYKFPGECEDKLFGPGYRHVHHSSCTVCCSESAGFCESAAKASCAELRCDETNLVARERDLVKKDYCPQIFIGRVGSSNMVMKSGEDRDRIVAEQGIIAFEMEGAGVWDEVPCVVVKGICDYSDSHKNKRWQDFAAATAASVARAMLERYARDDVH